MHYYHLSPDYASVTWPQAKVEDFKSFLQMNPNEFDSDLDLQRCLKVAAGQWEAATDEVAIQTTFTQTLNLDDGRFPWTIYLMKRPYVNLTSVAYVNSTDQTITATDGNHFDLDPTGRVASIRWRTHLSLSRYKRPKITIVFVAGYTATTIPEDTLFAVFSLAKWHFLNRSAYTLDKPAPMPGNFHDLATKHMHGRGWL